MKRQLLLSLTLSILAANAYALPAAVTAATDMYSNLPTEAPVQRRP